MADVIININVSAVADKVQKAWEKGLHDLSAEVLDDCNLYCKELTGALIRSSYNYSRLYDGELIWRTPYARRQYWEIMTARKPGTTWKWCETAKSNYTEKWRKSAQRLLEVNL